MSRTREITREERIKAIVSGYLMPAVTLALLVGAWEAACRIFEIPVWLLPSPSAIAIRLMEFWSLLLYHAYVTFYESILGFFVAVILAIPISIAIAYSRMLQNTIYPILLVFQTVPKVAIAPVIVMWFGLGLESKIVIAFLVSFFVIVVNLTTGFLTAPPELIDIARLLNAKKTQIFLKIRLPYAMPFFFSGLKSAITLSIVGAVIGEFVASSEGLGYVILAAAPQLDTDIAFAAILMLSVIGLALFATVHVLERIFVPWAFRETR